MTVGQRQVTVRANTSPIPLQAFELLLKVSPDAHAVSATLKMQGMDMGENRYRLKHDGPGLWHGTITLPVCVSGRRDWRMAIEIDGVKSELAFQSSAS